MQLNLPAPIKKITDTLEQHGFEVYYVGGCVRDAYMELEVHDFDATTNATPWQMKEVLTDFKIIETGIKHGTLTVLSQGWALEITTYRSQEIYQNHRQPASIVFAKTLKEDLSRRDFTINALAYHEVVGLIDEFHGIEDIHHRLIRCIGNPSTRFEEDALRILRGIRFACRFHFDIEKETKQAMIQKSHLLHYVSIERCRDELFKMLEATDTSLYAILHEAHVLDRFHLTYSSQIEASLSNSYPDCSIRLALLLQNHSLSLLKEWKCSKKIIHEVTTIFNSFSFSYKNIKNLRHLLWQTKNDFSLAKKVLLAHHESLDLLNQMIEEKDYLITLSIQGQDCLDLGYQGKQIHQILSYCTQLCLDDLSLNQKKVLLEIIKKEDWH